MRPEVCVGAVVRCGPTILLIQRANPPQAGRWSLPGGRVEIGETLVDAICREVLEETGVPINVTRFIAVVERISDTHHFVIIDYLAEPATTGEPPVARAATDAAAAQWMPIADLAALDLTDGLLDFLEVHRLNIA